MEQLFQVLFCSNVTKILEIYTWFRDWCRHFGRFVVENRREKVEFLEFDFVVMALTFFATI